MTRKLPLLSMLWLTITAGVLGEVFGQTPSTSQPQALLAAAITSLESRDSVSAKIRYEIDLFDKHLVGSGLYLEQRPSRDHLLRLELRIQLGDKTSSMVQVCDGQYLWTHQKMPQEVKLTSIDLVRTARALRPADNLLKPTTTNILPGLGGLPKLLRGLQSNFDFTTIELGRWGKTKQPVWRLQGHWNRASLVRLLPSQKDAIEKGNAPDLSKLSNHLPDQVVLLLGQEDLFPYRIEYRRALAVKPSTPDEPTSRPLVSMDLFEVNINVPIDPTQFSYNPGDMQVIDQTEEFLASLGVKK